MSVFKLEKPILYICGLLIMCSVTDGWIAALRMCQLLNYISPPCEWMSDWVSQCNIAIANGWCKPWTWPLSVLSDHYDKLAIDINFPIVCQIWLQNKTNCMCFVDMPFLPTYPRDFTHFLKCCGVGFYAFRIYNTAFLYCW